MVDLGEEQTQDPVHSFFSLEDGRSLSSFVTSSSSALKQEPQKNREARRVEGLTGKKCQRKPQGRNEEKMRDCETRMRRPQGGSAGREENV